MLQTLSLKRKTRFTIVCLLCVQKQKKQLLSTIVFDMEAREWISWCLFTGDRLRVSSTRSKSSFSCCCELCLKRFLADLAPISLAKSSRSFIEMKRQNFHHFFARPHGKEPCHGVGGTKKITAVMEVFKTALLLEHNPCRAESKEIEEHQYEVFSKLTSSWWRRPKSSRKVAPRKLETCHQFRRLIISTVYIGNYIFERKYLSFG